MVSVLFLCTGNICRSPTAEAVFRSIVKQRDLQSEVIYDSAGTHGYHIGEKPDSRSVQMAEKHGVDMSKLRARKLALPDFEDFDYIIAMDAEHARFAYDIKPQNAKAEIALLLDFHPDHAGRDVPDPYYGTEQDFKHTFDLIEVGVRALADNIL